MIFKNSTQRILGIGLLILVFLPLAAPVVTHAVVTSPTTINDGEVDDCDSWFPIFCYGQKLLNWAVRWIMAIFLAVVGLLVALMSAIIELMIAMSRDVIGGNPLVQNGFRITLGIANLGFVLAIIVIAFATILRIEKYELKKTLQRLIIAAILVNFSLAIAGLIFDFTNVLAYFFINKADPGAGGALDFGKEMAASLNIQDLVNIKDAVGGPAAIGPLKDVADLIGSFYTNFVSLFIALVFSIIILVVFAALAFMLVVRYLYLTVLIILMPLAWLFWTIPDLEGYWKKWWDKFFQWTFFLPAVTFFLYLAMLSSRGIDSVVASHVQQQFTNPFGSATAVEGSLLQNSGATGLLQLIVKIGFFVAALMAGEALKITGAKVALGGLKKMGEGFTGWKKGTVEKKMGAFGKGAAEKMSGGLNYKYEKKEGAGILSRFTGWTGGKAAGLARKTGLRGIAGVASEPIKEGTTKIKAQEEATLEREATGLEKQYREGEVSLEELRKSANRRMSPTGKAFGPTTFARDQEIATARVALARIQGSTQGLMTDEDLGAVAAGEVFSKKLPEKEKRRNAKMTIILEARSKTRTEKAEKKHKEESEEELHEILEKHGWHKKKEGEEEGGHGEGGGGKKTEGEGGHSH